MTTPAAPPPSRPDRTKLWSSGQELARTAIDELTSGALQLRSAGLRSPPPNARGRSLAHGFVLPFVIAKRLWRDPGARRQYLRSTIPQALLTLLIGAFFAYLSNDWRKDVETPDELRGKAAVRVEEAERLRALAKADAAMLVPFIDEQLAAARLEEQEEALEDAQDAQQEAADPERAGGEGAADAGAVLAATEAQVRSAQEQAEQSRRAAEQAAERVRESVRRSREKDPGAIHINIGPPGSALRFQVGDDANEDPEEEDSKVPEAPEVLAREVAASERDELVEAETPADRLAHLRETLQKAATVQVRRADTLQKRADEIEEAGGLWVHRGLLLWAALVSALYIVQLFIIWLAREYHEAIEGKASLLVGVPPEGFEEKPRVRFNLRWVGKKMRRRWRALWMLGTGFPIIYAVKLFTPDVLQLYAILSGLWFAYWWVVWSAAKTAYAWTEPPKDPWFLRGWDTLTSRVIFFKWFAPRAYGRLWRRFTQSLQSPATCAEQQPWTMAGLGAARALGAIPVVKIFLRPFFPVAAAVLIEERRGRVLAAEASEAILDAQLAPEPDEAEALDAPDDPSAPG